jgi:hypothetical protein
MTDFTPWIELFLFVATVIGGSIKYGSDQQRLKSKNDMQDLKIDNLQKQCDDDKGHNLEQHKEFYANRDATTELKSDMKHIMGSLEDIKKLLGERRGQQ